MGRLTSSLLRASAGVPLHVQARQGADDARGPGQPGSAGMIREGRERGPAKPPVMPRPAGATSAAARRPVRDSGGNVSGITGADDTEDHDAAGEPIPGQVLRRARRCRGWSQPRLAAEMHRVARASRLVLPGIDSLKTMISRWENGHRLPDEYNREVLCAALGIPVSALGLPNDADTLHRDPERHSGSPAAAQPAQKDG